MSLFEDILTEDEALFQNEEALDFEYLPKLLPFREEQQKYMAECIKPLFQGRKGRNLFIYGHPGVGKTACVRSIFRELQEFTDKIIPCYVNCWKLETPFAILSEIATQLGSFYHKKRSQEALYAIQRKARNLKGIALAFDEIDKARNLDFLYKLLDLRNITIFLITNKKEFLSSLEFRLRTRLALESLELEPYTYEQTEIILKERLKLAFMPNVFPAEVFKEVAKATYKLKDIRVGLYLMLEAGRFAERDGCRKIEMKHLDLAKDKYLDEFPIRSSPTTEEEKAILKLIKKNPGITTGELLQLFMKEGYKLPERTFRNYLKKLHDQNLIKRKVTGRGFRGKSMKWWLSYF